MALAQGTGNNALYEHQTFSTRRARAFACTETSDTSLVPISSRACKCVAMACRPAL